MTTTTTSYTVGALKRLHPLVLFFWFWWTQTDSRWAVRSSPCGRSLPVPPRQVIGSGRVEGSGSAEVDSDVYDYRNTTETLWIHRGRCSDPMILCLGSVQLVFTPVWQPARPLRRLHQVESSVLLHQFLPLPGLNQTVDHRSQCVPVQTEAPPTAALREAGSLLATANEIRTNLRRETTTQCNNV